MMVIKMIKFNLKNLLEEKNYSITKLHSETGISRNSLTLLANGKSQGVQFETLEKISNALNVDLSELFVRSFDDLTFKIIGKEIKDVKDLPQRVEEKGEGLREINRDRFEENTLNTLKCKLVIDNEEKTFYFPYRLIIRFNPTPSLNIEVDLKRYDIDKTFQFLYNDFFYLGFIFNYYFTNTIFKFENDFINTMIEEYNLNAYILKLYADIYQITDYQVISLTKNFQTNKKNLNEEIKNFNKSYSYNIALDNSINITSK